MVIAESQAIKVMHGLIRCSALVCVKANHEYVLKQNLLEQKLALGRPVDAHDDKDFCTKGLPF